jgi:excisionase family DNA binding protein
MQTVSVLTPKEVAAALKVHHNTVLRWLDKGMIEGFQLPGGDWRIYRAEVERIMTPQPAAAESAQA